MKSQFDELGATVVGISADRPVVQRLFIDKFDLTIPMIPDTSKEIIHAYGAAEVLGVTAKRTTFLIDPEGRIAHVWSRVTVEGHDTAVLDMVRTFAEKAERS